MSSTRSPSTRINWKQSHVDVLVGNAMKKRIMDAKQKGEWSALGKKEGLKIWRIENFTVKVWPRNRTGKFHRGDAYLILHTYKEKGSSSQPFGYNVHIWIGDECSQDEYATAMYKMVEVDEYLKGKPVQHREIQEQESELFLGYFNKQLTYLQGGIDSGFEYAEPTNAEPHLYRIKGAKKGHLELTQLPVRRDSMNAGDVFILVAGPEAVYVWVGNESNADEKAKAMEVANAFATEHDVVVLEQGINDGEKQAPIFWGFMPAKVSTLGIFRKSIQVQESDDQDDKVKGFLPVLYELPKVLEGRLRKLITAKEVPPATVAEGEAYGFPRHYLKEGHGYLLDTGFHVYVYLAKNASHELHLMAMPEANEYFQRYTRPQLPVTVLKAGQTEKDFDAHFIDGAKGASCLSSCTIL